MRPKLRELIFDYFAEMATVAGIDEDFVHSFILEGPNSRGEVADCDGKSSRSSWRHIARLLTSFTLWARNAPPSTLSAAPLRSLA